MTLEVNINPLLASMAQDAAATRQASPQEAQDGEAAALDFLHAPVGVPESMRTLTPGAAMAARRLLQDDPNYRAKALERGTPHARINLLVNGAIAGKAYTEAELDRLARGLSL